MFVCIHNLVSLTVAFLLRDTDGNDTHENDTDDSDTDDNDGKLGDSSEQGIQSNL